MHRNSNDFSVLSCQSIWWKKLNRTQINGMVSHVHRSKDLMFRWQCCPMWIYRFNTVPIQLPGSFFPRIRKIYPEFTSCWYGRNYSCWLQSLRTKYNWEHPSIWHIKADHSHSEANGTPHWNQEGWKYNLQDWLFPEIHRITGFSQQVKTANVSWVTTYSTTS